MTDQGSVVAVYNSHTDAEQGFSCENPIPASPRFIIAACCSSGVDALGC